MSTYSKTIDSLWIGYDSGEDVAYKVARYTAQKHTPNLQVFPIVQDSLRALGIYERARDLRASNDFSITRFLTPYLAGFKGLALFTDCDMLFTKNLNEMVKGLDLTSKAVWVVKHNYTPRTSSKMDGKPQYVYPKKNWASVMLFNCEHPAVRALSPDYVNKATPADLHQFAWIDESLIGELNPTWNFLIGEYDAPDADAKLLTKPTAKTPAVLHYTLGVPRVHDELFTADYAHLFEATYTEYLADKANGTYGHSAR